MDYLFDMPTDFKVYGKSFKGKTFKDLKLLNTNEKIPLLKDVLEFVDGRVPLLIEVKKCYGRNKDYKKRRDRTLSWWAGKNIEYLARDKKSKRKKFFTG